MELGGGEGGLDVVRTRLVGLTQGRKLQGPFVMEPLDGGGGEGGGGSGLHLAFLS